MKRWLVVTLLMTLAIPAAFSWPNPGAIPSRGAAARSFAARSFPRYGAASPPIISSGNTAVGFITLLGCVALAFGSLGWAGCYWQQHAAREAMHRRLNAVVAELATIYEANAKAEFARRLIEDKSG